MKTLKEIEQLMMQSSRCKNSDYSVAYENLVIIYRFKDENEGSNHCQIINSLYNVKVRSNTLFGISITFNVSDNALRRYRIQYAKLFLYFLKIEQNKKTSLNLQ